MSASFTKLFSSITESTVWGESHATRIVWITMLAMADQKGMVSASVPGLANRARVTVPDCEEALARFQQPDRYSRTMDYEGRRIEVVDGGWRLLNYEKYRELGNPVRASLDMEGYVYYAGVPSGRSVKIGFSKNPWARINDLRVTNPALEILATEKGTMALEKQRHAEFADFREDGEWFSFSPSLKSLVATLATRDLRKSTVARKLRTVGAEAEAEAEAEKTKPLAPSGAFERFWEAYPRKKSKGQAEKAWIKLRPSEQLAERILASVERAKTSADWLREGGQFVPYPATWLNAKGWEDELPESSGLIRVDA